MNRLLIFAFLVIFALLVVWLLFFRTPTKHVPPVKEKESLMLDIVSCGCPDLATSHPGRIKHKMTCSVFRSLNPGLTVKQFLEHEGFPTDKDSEWPKLP
ncbi:hypothetical protein A9K97_gp069 [Tokyovirus A1]|uniref:hypothetical protein n=1 Tax=Tokyovirus A1 TaxID=1826170 RepID=UPI0007A97302|nr:hypothetical protein A9K97_gp069 [Tokyovirus A1]BAU80282.1 hypothetical protein [Tokyovirus A1]